LRDDPWCGACLCAVLLEHANLGASRLAFDDANDARVGDVGGPGDDFAAVTFDEQDAVERQLRTGRSCGPLDQRDRARRDLH